MGLVWSLLRGHKDSLSERKRAMESAQIQIKDVDRRLVGYKGTHRWIVWTLLKVFVVLELLLGMWYWLHTKPADFGCVRAYNGMVTVATRSSDITRSRRSKLVDAAPLLVWPVLVFAIKRLMDWFYGLRIRRDETKLRALYDEQRSLLKAIENDPVFQQNLELLKQFGKDVPNYRAPSLPSEDAAAQAVSQQPDVRRRPVVARAAGDAMVRKIPPPESAVGSPARGVRGSGQPESGATPVPSTPVVAREYTQPVARTPVAARRPVNVSGQNVVGRSGGMFGWLVDAVVGDGLELSVPLNCHKCGTNNGLVSRDEAEARQSFVCAACQELNVIGDAAQRVPPSPAAATSDVRTKKDN